jgi:hypothetical protein
VNLQAQSKYTLITDEVSLIYNTKKSICIHYKKDEIFETIVLNKSDLTLSETRSETLYSFFKCIYHVEEKRWCMLDFTPDNSQEHSFDKKYQNGYFHIKEIGNF